MKQTKKLWAKNIDTDSLIQEFTIGNDRETDLHIAKFDLLASKAHADMLAEVQLITEDENKLLQGGLDSMLEQLEKGEFHIDSAFEDVHSKIEFELIEQLGEVGKKIHTARSRNDQVLVALQLYYKEQLNLIIEKASELFAILMRMAQKHTGDLMPGYTHLQVAMPSSFGLWFSAYAEVLIEDIRMLKNTHITVDQNPLGSAAGYGSSFPIDREHTTKTLGFSNLKVSSAASQLSRGKNDRLIAQSIGELAGTITAMMNDICLFMNQNFGLVSFPDELTTGSSIMPHKKNPDVFELIRAHCNSIKSAYNEVLLITQNLTSGYHRDYQLLKQVIISAIYKTHNVLDVLNYALPQMEVNPVDFDDETYSYIFSVEEINELVMNGMTFREAYKQVALSIENGTYKNKLSKKHQHIGSIHNPRLDLIQSKFNEL